MLALENFAAWALSTHDKQHNKPAVVDDHVTLTYGQLREHVEKFAGYLQSLDCQPQQRIIISMDDSVSWPVVFFAALYVGMNPVLVSNAMPVNDIERIIHISDAKVIVSDHHQKWSILCINKDTVLSCGATVQKDFYRFHPDEPCLWLLSSGSTGEPKCIVNRHANLYNLLKLVTPAAGLDSHSNIYSTAKMSWTYGFNVSVTFALGLGATAHVSSGLPAPSRIYKKLQQHNITHLWTVPGVLAGMQRHPKDQIVLPLRIFSSGESLPSQIAQAFLDQYDRKICEVFGMSETTQIYCMQTLDTWQSGTIGKPLPGVKYQLRDSNGATVGPGQVGELFVSSPCQASMYWKDWARTQATFQGAWVRTGDQCRVNEQGNLLFVGRTDDLIKIKGLYVSPVEIENAIVNLPGIQDCTVVHAPNSQGLAELHAFVVTVEAVNQLHIQQALQKQLPDHKVPKHIKFVDSLPKTLTNKKIRNVLRQDIANIQKV
jgi:benzoate-CoA ligase